MKSMVKQQRQRRESHGGQAARKTKWQKNVADGESWRQRMASKASEKWRQRMISIFSRVRVLAREKRKWRQRQPIRRRNENGGVSASKVVK
jgi:hypothetical protein